MKCNKKNCPLVGNNENCDIRDCKWRTEDATDTDLIRRSDVIKAVSEPYNESLWDNVNQPISDVVNILNAIPAVEPKHGEWIISEVRFGNYKYQCKVCGWHEHHAYNDVKPYNFCPNCGARMFAKDTNIPNKLPMSAKHEAE